MRTVDEILTYAQQRINVIEANLVSYGTSRGRAMIEAYQDIIDYSQMSDLLIDNLDDDEAAYQEELALMEGGEL